MIPGSFARVSHSDRVKCRSKKWLSVKDVIPVKEKTGSVSKHRVLDIDIDKVKVGPESGSGEVVLKLKDDGGQR